MSKWVEGKLELKCSLNILRKAIVNIMPQWEQHLIVDETGHIPMYRFNGQRDYDGEGGDKEVHLLIPGSRHPGVAVPPERGSHNDWGFKHNTDGSWDVTFADFGLQEAKQLENKIKGEVALMKAKAVALMKGFDIVYQAENEDEKCIDIRVDTSSYEA